MTAEQRWWELAAVAVGLAAFVAAFLAVVYARRNERRGTERNDVDWTISHDEEWRWWIENQGLDPALDVTVRVSLDGVDHEATFERIDAQDWKYLPMEATPQYAAKSSMLVPKTFRLGYAITWATPAGSRHVKRGGNGMI